MFENKVEKNEFLQYTFLIIRLLYRTAFDFSNHFFLKTKCIILHNIYL